MKTAISFSGPVAVLLALAAPHAWGQETTGTFPKPANLPGGYEWTTDNNGPPHRLPVRGTGYKYVGTQDTKRGLSMQSWPLTKTMRLGELWSVAGFGSTGVLQISSVLRAINHPKEVNRAAMKKGKHTWGIAVDIYPIGHNGAAAPGSITGNTAYSRQNTRLLLQMIRALGASNIWFNDKVLVKEGLCRFSKGHYDHIHVDWSQNVSGWQAATGFTWGDPAPYDGSSQFGGNLSAAGHAMRWSNDEGVGAFLMADAQASARVFGEQRRVFSFDFDAVAESTVDGTSAEYVVDLYYNGVRYYRTLELSGLPASGVVLANLAPPPITFKLWTATETYGVGGYSVHVDASVWVTLTATVHLTASATAPNAMVSGTIDAGAGAAISTSSYLRWSPWSYFSFILRVTVNIQPVNAGISGTLTIGTSGITAHLDADMYSRAKLIISLAVEVWYFTWDVVGPRTVIDWTKPWVKKTIWSLSLW